MPRRKRPTKAETDELMREYERLGLGILRCGDEASYSLEARPAEQAGQGDAPDSPKRLEPKRIRDVR